MTLRTLLLLLFFSASTAHGESRPGPPPALVVTGVVTADPAAAPLTLIATAEAFLFAEVAVETPGLVESFATRRGELVAKGAELLKLRSTRQELLRDEALARRNEGTARLAKAADDAARAEELFAQAFISREELQARTLELDLARRQIKQLEAALALQKDRLAGTVIRAPFGGRVVDEKTEIGQWLDEGDAALTLADLSRIRLMVAVPEQRIAGVTVGSAVAVRFDALPGQVFSGRVHALIPQADNAARTFPVEVLLENPRRSILGGMLGRVTFETGAAAGALSIPRDALVPRPDGSTFVVRAFGGQAEIVRVRVLSAAGDRYAVTVLEGELHPGDRVVTRGNERLRSGQSLREADAAGHNQP